MRDESGESLVLHGPPRRLQMAVAGLDNTADTSLSITERVGRYDANTQLPVSVRKRSTDACAQVRLSLENVTPPGSYGAVFRAGSRQFPVRLVVDKVYRVRAFPGQSVLAAAPKTKLSFLITVENIGNIEVEIPSSGIAGIFNDVGLENSFAEMHRSTPETADAAVAQFFGKVKDGYGGMLKLKIDGAGVLAPGSARTLTVSTSVPEKLGSGISYHGYWRFCGQSHGIRVRVL